MVHDSGASPICLHLDASLFSPYFCLPMTAQGEMMGLLHIQRLPSETGTVSGIFPSESQQRLAVIIGEHISLALANLRLREALRAQSIRDPLTGLFNRRYMEESLDRELPRASREKTSLGVVLIDLDHFKQFNDTFGHAAGDTLLARVGLFLRNQIRSEDIACRYGGEEFILILPGSSLEATRARAERIRQHLRQMSIGYEGQTLGTITLSAGVAAFPHDGSNAKAVLRAADDALYHAKSKGRDRVMIAQDVKQLPQTEPSSFRVC